MKNGILFGMTIIAGALAYAYIKTTAFKTQAAVPVMDLTSILGPGWVETPGGGAINTNFISPPPDLPRILVQPNFMN